MASSRVIPPLGHHLVEDVGLCQPVLGQGGLQVVDHHPHWPVGGGVVVVDAQPGEGVGRPQVDLGGGDGAARGDRALVLVAAGEKTQGQKAGQGCAECLFHSCFLQM